MTNLGIVQQTITFAKQSGADEAEALLSRRRRADGRSGERRN